MDKKELIQKLRTTHSFVDFFKYKDEIIKALEGEEHKGGAKRK